MQYYRVFSRAICVALAGFVLCLGRAQGAPTPVAGTVPQAPPPAPPIGHRTAEPPAPQPVPFGLNLYSIGQPTDEEQLYLEYINRMRANPTAEGVRLATTTDPNVLSSYSYFGVDTTQLEAQFATNLPVPPLAMNAQLIAAARWHSGDMFTNQYQGHYQTNGAIIMDPGARMLTNGYNWAAYGENVYAYADYVFYGHAGFAVDWGPGPYGMQSPPGHRDNMLDPEFREVGIGVVDGVNGTVGPQIVTQDFGLQNGAKPFITGVVYYDLEGSGFYDVGEGISGVTVNTTGSAYYAVTAGSGGYAIPITSNGNYTITFTAPNLSTQRVVTVSGLSNVKLDLMPTYSPPVISGPNPAYLNTSNTYTFSPVAAATAYQWQQTQLAPYTNVEGAENGLVNVTAVTSPGYPVQTSDLAASGTYSFHLAQPVAANQYLTLNPVLQVSAGSQLIFAKYLGYATTTQIAKAQVSTDGGATWQDVWSQAGNNSSGDSSFHTNTISLSAYAGQNIQVRFAYLYTGGTYYNETSTGVGFYIDNISISAANQLLNAVTNNVASGTSFVLYPTSSGSYLLQVRAQIGSRLLNWGPSLTVATAVAPPSLQIVSKPTLTAGQVQVDFTVNSYRTGMTFQLWKAPDPTGPWTQDASATLSTLVANSKYRFTTSQGTATRTFYKVKGTY